MIDNEVLSDIGFDQNSDGEQSELVYKAKKKRKKIIIKFQLKIKNEKISLII